MAIKRCGYNGCRNPVKQNDTAYYVHREAVENDNKNNRLVNPAMSQQAIDDLEHYKHMGVDLTRVKPMSSNAFVERQNKILETSYIAEDALNATDKLRMQLKGITIPSQAMAHARNADSFAIELEKQLGVGRVHLIRLEGLTRQKKNGRTETFNEGMHTAFVIDYGRDTETLYDPYIDAFAPSKDGNASVLSEFSEDTSSLFCDGEPFIGAVDEYVNGNEVRWNSWKIYDLSDFEVFDGTPIEDDIEDEEE